MSVFLDGIPPQADWGLDRMTCKPSYQNPWQEVLPLKPRFRSSRAGRPSFGPAIRRALESKAPVRR